MAEVKLAYGDGECTLTVPDENFGGLFEPKKLTQSKDSAELIEEAFAECTVDLAQMCEGKVVTFLNEDGTRSGPHELMIEALTSRLAAAKLIKYVIATGTHKAETEGNEKIKAWMRAAAEKYGVAYEIHVHDCRTAQFVELGATSQGTQVKVNSIPHECDLFVVASDAKNHYFSGYSNPIKNFLPGVCAFETVEHNHSFALDDTSTFGRHPLHPDANRRAAKVAGDQYEGAKMIIGDRPVFTLCVTSSNKKVMYARAGLFEDVIPQLLTAIDEMTSHTVKPSQYIVVSPGKYPDDSCLYISQRALELTKNAVLKGGEILFLSECREGITYDEPTLQKFYVPMKQPLADMLKIIEEKYVLYSHKAYKFAKLIEHTHAIHVYSQLEPHWFTDVHLKAAEDPQKIIDGWIAKDPNARILFFNNANKLAVYAE